MMSFLVAGSCWCARTGSADRLIVLCAVCLQEQTFLRDFGLFVNNIEAANNSAHSNLTSWTW
jgi:hypothetical protein